MPASDTILERLRILAASALNLNLTDGELAAWKRVDEVAGFDSLAVLEFVAAIEKEFGVKLQEDELRIEVINDMEALARRLSTRLSPAC